jgi:hypothetical protein
MLLPSLSGFLLSAHPLPRSHGVKLREHQSRSTAKSEENLSIPAATGTSR